MGADRPDDRLRQRKLCQLRQAQPAGDGADFFLGVLQGGLDAGQFLRNPGARLVLFRATDQRIQFQQRQAQVLGGAIVKLGADPAQEALVQGRHTAGRAAHSLVQLLVLRQQLGQAGDLVVQRHPLLLDGLARALDEARQQEIDHQGRASHHEPAPALRCSHFLVERVDRLVELRHGNHLVRPGQADGAVGLEQLGADGPFGDIFRSFERADRRADLAPQRQG